MWFWRRHKAGGYIAHYRLEKWWFSTFNKHERAYVQQKLGNDFSNVPPAIPPRETSAFYLSSRASSFQSREDKKYAFEFLLKAEKLATASKDYLALHSAYTQLIELYYRDRDTDTKALETAIKYCEKHINYANQITKAWRKLFPKNPLPHHKGYEQLAIIYEKQGNNSDAIRLCQQAKKQNWPGDWDARIARYKKK